MAIAPHGKAPICFVCILAAIGSDFHNHKGPFSIPHVKLPEGTYASLASYPTTLDVKLLSFRAVRVVVLTKLSLSWAFGMNCRGSF